MKSPACFHQVTFGLRWVPAKYSFPGSPNSLGEEVNVCQTILLTPEQKTRSILLFKSLGARSHCGPIEVGPSAATNLLPLVWATQALCLTASRSASVTRCVFEVAQNSPWGKSLIAITFKASTGAEWGPPDSG